MWRVFVFMFLKGVVWGCLGSDPLGGSGAGGDWGGVVAVGGKEIIGWR